jgi:hypothetical protein
MLVPYAVIWKKNLEMEAGSELNFLRPEAFSLPAVKHVNEIPDCL